MKKISQDVLAVLDRCAFTHTHMALPEQLDRKLYQEVAKVILAAGGKWSRSERAHVFDGDAAAAIEPIILTGEVTNAKQEFGQFDTPMPLARDLARRAGVKKGMQVLEPSCGVGNLVCAAEEFGADVTGYERDAARAEKANTRCAFAGGLHIQSFLLATPSHDYDVVLMNPPFARKADIEHVMFAMDFLRPGGTLVAVMSAGVMFRGDRLSSRFRELIEDLEGSFAALPENSFKESGTAVNAIVLTLRTAR